MSGADIEFTIFISRNQTEMLGLFLAFCALLVVALTLSNNWRRISEQAEKLPYLQQTVLPRWLAISCLAVLGVTAMLLGFAIVTTVANLTIAMTRLNNGGIWSGETLRGVAFTIGAIVGVPFLVWRSWVAHRQADTAEHELTTERLTSAAKLLESDAEAVRIAGLHSLFRLAEENPELLGTVSGVFESCIRDISTKRDVIEFDDPIPEVEPGYLSRSETAAGGLQLHNRRKAVFDWARDLPKPPEELQTAIVLLGRLPVPENHRLDFSGCNFQSIRFTGVDYSRAKFIGTRFDGAIFDNCTVNNAHFHGTGNIERVGGANNGIFYRNPATFLQCTFLGFNANNTDFSGAIFDSSIFRDAEISSSLFSGVSFHGATISGLAAKDCLFYRARLDTIWDMKKHGLSSNLLVDCKIHPNLVLSSSNSIDEADVIGLASATEKWRDHITKNSPCPPRTEKRRPEHCPDRRSKKVS